MTTQIKAGVIAANAITASELASSALSGGSFTGDVTFDTNTLVVDSANNRVGIGTDSPSRNLEIAGTESYLKFNSSHTDFTIGSDANGFIVYDDTNAAYRLTLDSSGNVGIGATPSAYNSSYRAIDISNSASVMGYTGNNGAWLLENLYYGTDNNWKHKNSDFSGLVEMYDGVFNFYNTASGTAGATATLQNRLSITSSGNVGISDTNPSYPLSVTGISSATTEFRLNNSFSRVAQADGAGAFAGGYNFYLDGSAIPRHDSGGALSGYYYNADGSIRFYTATSQAADQAADERLRIDSSGVLQIGNSGQIKFANNNISPPNTSNHSEGTRITFYDAGGPAWYAMGMESNTLWFESDEDFKWYKDGTEVMRLRGSKCLDVKNGLGTGPITSCSGFSGTAGNSYLIKPPGAMEPFWAVYSGDNYKGRGKGYFRWWYGYGDAATGDNQNKVEVDLVDLGYQFYEVIVEDMANTTYGNSAPAWEYAYWSSLQTFNTTTNSGYATSSGVGNGTVRAMWGYAGGHGLYDSTVNTVCSWGSLDSHAAIGSGYDGTCGVWGNTPTTTSPHTGMTGHTLRLGRPQYSSAFYTESTGAFSYWFNF